MSNAKNGMVSSATTEASTHGCTTKKRNKIVISVVVTILLILVAGLFYVGFSGIWKPNAKKVKLQTCTSSSCVHTATEILRHIDIRANPCEDFYRFSCGNFLQNTYLDDNRGSRSESRSVEDITRDEIQSRIREILEVPIRREDPKPFNTAKKFYRACMNETSISQRGLEKIKEILKSTGGWPTLEGYNWNHEKFDWMESLHKLRQKGVNFDVFFRVAVVKDNRGSNSRYVISIHDIPYNQNKPSDIMNVWLFEYMVDIAIMFGADNSTAEEDAREMLRIFLELGKITKESFLHNRTEVDYERRDVSELLYKYRDIQWHHYLSGLLEPATNVNYDDEVLIASPRYVAFMENFLAITPKRSLANFISWNTINSLMNYMPAKIAQRTVQLYDKINRRIMNFKKDRSEICVAETKKNLGSVLSAAFIQNFLPEHVRFKVILMIRHIKKQAEQSIARLEWMDLETKRLIIETLHRSGEKLPSTGDLLNILEENKSLYSQVNINETNYLEAALELNLVTLFKEQSKLRSTYREDLFSDISFVSGLKIKYSPRENMLTFPVGIFSGVYYQNERPEYMNYGILGSRIAHEVSHIFMRAVRGDLPPGELRSWWSSNSLANYDQKLQCLTNQYNNFRLVELRRKHPNPGKTPDEDMADLAGMKISYDTYINWSRENGAQPLLPGLKYSPNQLFWISAAIRHCSKYSADGLESFIDNYNVSPHQFRVNGPLQNLEEFAFDFGCLPGSKMNPQTKCDVW